MYISILLRKRKRRTYYVSMHKPFSTSRRYSTLLQAPRRLRKLNICRFVSKEISDIIFIRPSPLSGGDLPPLRDCRKGGNIVRKKILALLNNAIELVAEITLLAKATACLLYWILITIILFKLF